MHMFMHRLQLILEFLGLFGSLLGEAAKNIGLALDLVTLGRGHATLLQDALESGQLLDNVVIALAELIKDADVVLGIGVFGVIVELFRSLLNFGGNVCQLGAASELGNQCVQSGNSASKTVKTTASNTVRASLLVDELNESLLGATARVLFGLLATSREPLDGGVGRDFLLLGDGLAVGCFSINLGNDNVGFVGEIGSKALPNRSQGLAV